MPIETFQRSQLSAQAGHNPEIARVSCAAVSKCCCSKCTPGLCGEELGDPWTIAGWLADPCHDCPWDFGGWTQTGYHTESTGLFNSIPDRANVHQQWFYLERAASPSNGGMDWGLRLDVMYGIDADDTQSFGNEPGTWDFQNGFDRGGGYGWAIPQLYGEIAWEDISVIFGHFYTLVGYEVVTAPDNFFYSHAYTMYNSEPFTHTGVLSTLTLTEKVTGYAGWTLGWDTGFNQNQGGNSFLGGFSVQVTDSTAITYITTFGDFGDRGEGYSHSIVMDSGLADNLNYVFQSDFVDAGGGDSDIGVNQYLIYSLTERLGIGTRVEWWHDDGVSYNEATFGINFRPCANVVVRPEFRHDWSPANGFDQSSFGIDSVLVY